MYTLLDSITEQYSIAWHNNRDNFVVVGSRPANAVRCSALMRQRNTEYCSRSCSSVLRNGAVLLGSPFL